MATAKPLLSDEDYEKWRAAARLCEICHQTHDISDRGPCSDCEGCHRPVEKPCKLRIPVRVHKWGVATLPKAIPWNCPCLETVVNVKKQMPTKQIQHDLWSGEMKECPHMDEVEEFLTVNKPMIDTGAIADFIDKNKEFIFLNKTSEEYIAMYNAIVLGLDIKGGEDE